MKLLEVFQADYDTVPKTISYKIKNNLLTIEAYKFAFDIPEAVLFNKKDKR